MGAQGTCVSQKVVQIESILSEREAARKRTERTKKCPRDGERDRMGMGAHTRKEFFRLLLYMHVERGQILRSHMGMTGEF